MKLTLVNLKKIPMVNFGIDKILSEKVCRFVLICLEFSGLPLFFFRIPKNPNDDFPIIFSCFLDEFAEQFSLKKDDIEKFVCDKGGGYLWMTKKDKKMEINGSNNYGVEYDQEFTINLLRRELNCEV